MSYATLAELKDALSVASTDTSSDTYLQAALDATDQLINNWCERPAGFVATSQTRYYTAQASDLCMVDDFVSITTLATDDAGDGTYSTVWSATDYVKMPRNAAVDSEPYDRLELNNQITRTFPVVKNGVKLIANFGYASSVPAAVKAAALTQCGAIWFSRSAPSGVVGSADLGGIMRLSRALHPEAQVLLEPYRKRNGLAV